MKRPTSTPSSDRFNGRCVALKLVSIFPIQEHPLFFYQIWLGLGISIVFIITVLNLIQRHLEYRFALETPPNDIQKGKIGKQHLYVFGNLLSQGLYISLQLFVL